MSKPFGSFEDKKTDFDAITSEINSKTTMKEIENVIEWKRQEIFDILSVSRIDCKEPEFKKSLEEMHKALDDKKTALETQLWEVTPGLNLLKDDNSDLVKYCKIILPTTPITGTPDATLAKECGDLLSYLQDVYTKWRWKKEVLFSGKKNPADKKFADLLLPDTFKEIMESTDEATLQTKIDEFVTKTFSPTDNSFGITKSKLYTSPVEQGKVAARIAIFLHCMQKALNEWKLDTTKITELKSILKKLEEEQIPKIRSIYNLKKEKDAVDAELATLVDLEKNDNADIEWTDTTTNIDLTDSFEGKSTDKAKKIDFYNLSKKDIKINISGTEYTEDDIVLKDSWWEKAELNIDAGSPSGDFDLYVKISWIEVKIWKINIDYTAGTKGSFILIQDPDAITNLTTALWTEISWDVDLSIPVMAVKKVRPVRGTWQISLTRKIVAKIKKWGGFVPIITWGSVDVEASISNVTEISREEAERVAEEQLRERYEDLPWYSPDRINLFFRRDYIKEKYVRKIMKDGKWFSWNDRDINATERQQLQKSQDKIFDDDIQTIDIQTKCPNTYTQLDNLCRSFIWTPPTFTSAMTPPEFQKKFADIINFDPPYDKPGILEVIWKERALTYSSNILIRLNMFVDHQRLVTGITNDIATITDDTLLEKSVRDRIKKYMDSYNDLPRFLEATGIKLEDANFWTNVRAANAALIDIQAQTMKLKMNVIKEWSAAYKIKQKKWLIANTWDVIDNGLFFRKAKKNMPLWLLETLWWTGWIVRTWWIIAATTVWWLLFWPLWATITSASTVWLRTLFSKYSHYTKEYEWQMKNEAVDLANYEAERSRLQAAVWWKKWYNTNRLWWKDRKDARHRNRYVRTTHGRSAHTINLANSIKSITNQNTALNPAQEWQLKKLVAEWYARLKYYKTTWQNFLWSDDVKYAEEDYRYLYAKLIAWAKRLWWMDATNPNKIDEAQITSDPNYDATMNVLESWYEEAISRFKGKRAALWIWNAAVTWAIAWWVSYLSTKIWWKKFWKWDEHNFVNPWDSSPTDPIVNVEKWWWSSSLQDVYASGMSANPGARWYKLIVSPEVDAIPTWLGTKHTLTNLQDYINDVRAMIPASDTKTLEAFDKATALHSPLPPRYKRSALEKAIAYASNNWADVWNQYLFGERFVANIESGLNARTAAGTTGVPIDNIVFWRKAATVVSSTPWSAWSLTERSMNWVIKIKTWGPGVWVPISRNTFKRHEWKVKPGSTAHP